MNKSMQSRVETLIEVGTRLAIQLLFLVVWSVGALSKVRSGVPSWFGEKFGNTFLAKLPGLVATFWILTLSELLAFGLVLVSLVRLEFLPGRGTLWLQTMLVWSLFVFVQLGLGQWITSEFNGAYMLFMYFCGVLLTLGHVRKSS